MDNFYNKNKKTAKLYKSNNLKKIDLNLKKSTRKTKSRPKTRSRALRFLVESQKANKTFENGKRRTNISFKEKMLDEYNRKMNTTSPFFFIPSLRAKKNPQLQNIKTYLVKINSILI